MDLTTYFSTIFTLSLSALIGVLGSKVMSVRNARFFTIPYYVLGLTAVLVPIFHWVSFDTPNFFGLVSLILGLVILGITYRFLSKKLVYKTSELTPHINKVTETADKDSIELFGGDLNFLGNTTAEMDSNSQYSHLKSMKFKNISILCENPGSDNETKIRYGKIYSELPKAVLRFYEPQSADLKIRGRILRCNGVQKLLMYSKVSNQKGLYSAIETNAADSNGVLYANIWELIWSLADQPNSDEIDEYKNLFNAI